MNKLQYSKSYVSDTRDILKSLYSNLAERFPDMKEWYLQGLRFSRDTKNELNIDSTFYKIYAHRTKFDDDISFIEHYLVCAIPKPHKKTMDVFAQKFETDITTALQTLSELEQICNLVQTREKVVRTIASRASRK